MGDIFIQGYVWYKTIGGSMENIESIIKNIYKEYFEFIESSFEEEFGLNIDTLKEKSGKKPFPYLKSIYSFHLHKLGLPSSVIAERIGVNRSNICIYSQKYNDYYKYNTEFKLLADRFNKRLKEKENE